MSATGEQIAEALKTDPVWIDPAVESQLNPTLMAKAQETIEGLDYPVYIIAVDAEFLDDDLLEQVKVFHGGEGSFIMINGATDLAVDDSFADTDQSIEISQQHSNAMDKWNSSTPSTTKLNILLDFYAAPEEHVYSEAITGQEQGSEVIDGTPQTIAGQPVVLVILAAVLLVAGVWLVRTLRRSAADRREAAKYTLPSRLLNRVDSLQRGSLRETISSETTALADTIEALQTANLTEADSDRVERALDAYRIARTIVDDESSARIDLTGAMVLIRQAGREIAEVEAGRRKSQSHHLGGGLPQALCTVNPLHGEARSTSRVDADGASIRVPVCRTCRDDLTAGRDLEWIFDGDRPYVEGTSIWARTLFGAIGGNLVTALHRERPELD